MSNKAKIATVTLEEPIVRGDTKLHELQIRKPASGELRGIALSELLTLKTDALFDLLPRITIPNITTPEAEALDTADLLKFAIEVASFFLPTEMKPEALRQATMIQ